MKRIVIIFLNSIVFMSCDPGLINNYVVENESDHLVEAKFRLQQGYRTINSTDTIQTIKINPQSKIEIVNYGEIGNAHDKKQYFLEAFDTIWISSINVLMKKNIVNRNNWKYRVIKRGLQSLDEVEYKLIIKNEDLIESN
jgi:hypothetical protein